MIEIRNVQEKDYEQIMRLENAIFEFHRKHRPDYFREHADYTRKEFEELLRLPVSMAFVATLEEEIVGICFGKIEKSRENTYCKARKIAVIDDLFVLPKYRGCGIASSIVKAAHEKAMTERAETLELCVWGFNSSAIQFYQKMGMKIQFLRMEQQLLPKKVEDEELKSW